MRRAIRAEPAASRSTKYSSLSRSRAVSASIWRLGLLILSLSKCTSAIGWTLMWLLTTNSIRARPTPSAGQPPPAERRGRVGEIEHHVRAGRRCRAKIDVFAHRNRRAVVDEALVALGAGDRDLLPVVQHLRRVAGAHDRRQAELAADDGGVRGAAAVVGDDRRGPLHDRHPVRVGHLGDQNGAVDEAVDLARAVDEADAARRDRVADAEPLDDELPPRRLSGSCGTRPARGATARSRAAPAR